MSWPEIFAMLGFAGTIGSSAVLYAYVQNAPQRWRIKFDHRERMRQLELEERRLELLEHERLLGPGK